MTTSSQQSPQTSAESSPVQPPPAVLRRQALAGVAVLGVGVPLLAACGADDSSSASDDSAGGSSSTPSPSEAESSAEGGGASDALTTTADVPEGSGTIFADQKVVVCQPSSGDFVCYTAVCTHQGCIVSSVEGAEIVCGCHNSRFSIEDGAPLSGPASSPLEAVEITVDGDSITLA